MVRNLTPDDIRTVLLRDWDPLGVGNNPKLSDEYDSCIPVIYRMIQAGTTVQEIQQYGRLRYRIKSDKIERVVTENELSYFQ